MTYNVFVGTLNLTQSINQLVARIGDVSTADAFTCGRRSADFFGIHGLTTDLLLKKSCGRGLAVFIQFSWREFNFPTRVSLIMTANNNNTGQLVALQSVLVCPAH